MNRDRTILHSFAEHRRRRDSPAAIPLGRPRDWLAVRRVGTEEEAVCADGFGGLVELLPELPAGEYHVRRVGSEEVAAVATVRPGRWEIRSW